MTSRVLFDRCGIFLVPVGAILRLIFTTGIIKTVDEDSPFNQKVSCTCEL